ncbi:hypothetical protein SAMN04489712_107260 [Thermomonospora echinospora]|uniref:Uncharacterized protein n=1 Tax=Thermomonospora echinospora TaxID=1992 RepID=A0A1H6BNC6_9ACTN|nr:hypothetical protein [Thermomonospora echinospora]SEG61955.1 hypothetical protein SAMN04489712_107260 [Thermomonospora echinospora]
MTDQPPDDDRTREIAIPERVSPDALDQTRQDEPAGAAATAPQPLPAEPERASRPERASQDERASRPEQASEAQPGPPPPGPAKATAPQVVPPEPPASPPAPQPTLQQPLPQQSAPQQPQPQPQPVQVTPPPPPQPMQAPSVPPPLPDLPGQQPRRVTFHRFHYPIGIFMVAYGVSTLLLSVLGWSAHRMEMAGYLGEGAASPALIAVKVVEGLLVLLALVGLVRRRDVWFLPALFGWVLGFAVFCVLAGVEGKMMDLVEHGAYLVVFTFLLCLSYALGVKARVAARQAVPPEPGQGSGGSGPDQGSGRLTRTQEIALAALNRWQRQQPAPPQGPHQPGPAPQQPQPPHQQFPPQPGPPQQSQAPHQPQASQQPQAPQQYGPPPQQQGAAPQGPGQFYSEPSPGPQ